MRKISLDGSDSGACRFPTHFSMMCLHSLVATCTSCYIDLCGCRFFCAILFCFPLRSVCYASVHSVDSALPILLFLFFLLLLLVFLPFFVGLFPFKLGPLGCKDTKMQRIDSWLLTSLKGAKPKPETRSTPSRSTRSMSLRDLFVLEEIGRDKKES